MFKIKVKGTESKAKVLQTGEHKVTIKDVKFIEHASENGAWADSTPKLEVKFGNAEGTIIGNYFLKGFKNFDNCTPAEKRSCIAMSSSFGAENYAVDKKTSNRIEDAEKTDKAMEILGRLVGDADLIGEEFDNTEELAAALIGKEIGIVVKHSEKESNDGEKQASYMEVAYTKPASKVKAKVEENDLD